MNETNAEWSAMLAVLTDDPEDGQETPNVWDDVDFNMSIGEAKRRVEMLVGSQMINCAREGYDEPLDAALSMALDDVTSAGDVINMLLQSVNLTHYLLQYCATLAEDDLSPKDIYMDAMRVHHEWLAGLNVEVNERRQFVNVADALSNGADEATYVVPRQDDEASAEGWAPGTPESDDDDDGDAPVPLPA